MKVKFLHFVNTCTGVLKNVRSLLNIGYIGNLLKHSIIQTLVDECRSLLAFLSWPLLGIHIFWLYIASLHNIPASWNPDSAFRHSLTNWNGTKTLAISDLLGTTKLWYHVVGNECTLATHKTVLIGRGTFTEHFF